MAYRGHPLTHRLSAGGCGQPRRVGGAGGLAAPDVDRRTLRNRRRAGDRAHDVSDLSPDPPHDELVAIRGDKLEAERARLEAETKLLKVERLAVLGHVTGAVARELRVPLNGLRD